MDILAGAVVSLLLLAAAWRIPNWWAKGAFFLLALGALTWTLSRAQASSGFALIVYALLLFGMAALALTDNSKRYPGERSVVWGAIYLLLGVAAAIAGYLEFDSTGTLWDRFLEFLALGWSVIVMLWEEVILPNPLLFSAGGAIVFLAAAYKLIPWILKILTFLIGLGAAAIAMSEAGIPYGVSFIIASILIGAFGGLATNEKTPGKKNWVIALIFFALAVAAFVYGMVNLGTDGTIWDTFVVWLGAGWDMVVTVIQFLFGWIA